MRSVVCRESFKALTAKELMSCPVLSLREDHSLKEAASFLMDHRIHGAPVMNRMDRLVGVLSMTDMARYEQERNPEVIPESDYYRLRDVEQKFEIGQKKGFHLESLDGPLVREVMTPSVISVHPDATLQEVVETLLTHRIHRVMVVRQPSGTLQGVITETDILKAFPGRPEGRVNPLRVELAADPRTNHLKPDPDHKDCFRNLTS